MDYADVQPYPHLDRQVLLHTVTDGPANNAPTVEIEERGEVEPALSGPDIADVACPFLVGRVRGEVAIQHIGYDSKAVIAVWL